MATVRISQAAARLGVSTDYIRDLEKRGLYKARRDPSGHRRFTELDLSELERLLCGASTAKDLGER